MRQSQLIQSIEHHLKSGHAFGVWLANDDRSIAASQRQSAFVQEFDRAGTIYESKSVAEECCIRDIELNAHGMFARFRTRVPHGALGCNRAGS